MTLPPNKNELLLKVTPARLFRPTMLLKLVVRWVPAKTRLSPLTGTTPAQLAAVFQLLSEPPPDQVFWAAGTAAVASISENNAKAVRQR